jgi:hypothetical protein
MLLSTTTILLAAGHRGAPDAWIPFIIVGAILIAVVVRVMISARVEKNRTAALKQVADTLGFEFFPTGDATYLAVLAGMPLRSRGRAEKLLNLMRGKSRSFEVAIFDYRYVTGGGRSSRTWRQSVVGFQSNSLALPDFTLGPKTFWNRMGPLFGRQSIEFETHPDFSAKYLLRGSDVEAIRSVFNISVLDYFQQNPGWNCEGSANRLLLYKLSKRVPPPETPTFLEEGLNVLSLIHAG